MDLKEYFSSKRALVTGASSGIGFKLALNLANLGAKVYAVGTSLTKLTELQNFFPQNIIIIQCNLANWQETELKLAPICNQGIDFLINNAGVGSFSPLEQITQSQVDMVLDINLKAPINLIRMVAPKMIEQKFGSIVNVSSLASTMAVVGHTVYGASKAALDQVTRNAANELAKFNIRVNSVNPTVVLTPMSEKFWTEESRKQLMLSRIPMQRFVEIDEVVKPILFYLSDASTMITGITMPIDGGAFAT